MKRFNRHACLMAFITMVMMGMKEIEEEGGCQ